MDQFHHLGIELQAGIAILTLRAPPSNFLSRRLVAELAECIPLVASDQVRAVIITGTGRVFSAGVDPAELSQIQSPAQGTTAATDGQAILRNVERLRKPVIAAINGLCLGGGLELALACHLRFCSEKARLGLPEITLGLIPGLGGTQRLPRLVGVSKALDLILTGDTIKAEVARDVGLVDRVVAADQVVSEARKFAQRLATRGTEVIAAAVESVVQGTRLSLEQGLSLEAEAFGRLCAGSERVQRMKHLSG